MTVSDVIGPDLDVLFCGINPGLLSAARGQHFARPGNRFWPALHLSGFTPRLLRPDEQDELLDHGLGITNLAARPTARADELTAQELRAGGVRLAELAAAYRPRVVAVVGITAYRTAFDRRHARVGPQPEPIAGSRLWVLPNPSGLNAHYRLADLAEVFGELRSAVARDRTGPGPAARAVARDGVRDDGAMRIREVEISDDMIRLGQFLKLAGLAENGAHARELVEDGEVTVNGRVEERRGAQLHDGDVIAVGAEKARLVAHRP
ncbi:hypothetical protein GCM10009660_18120 [Catellatospora bangladeshensis]|uniref:G:T/U-mismatch repair DNA glycosylase/ribosome-associated protein YbcJ (S4-like RNA binding protein) n=2 Tax=Saccharothrix algeriensis TaxID=173560 RepID=A0ABS2S1U1_9PSEU|nr:G:T/U-mismatch repair DNA glycosylase/ribosome-associated protein YbcJ (S4-like RNA binding protein) [Saccharothrix algeriensis]